MAKKRLVGKINYGEKCYRIYEEQGQYRIYIESYTNTRHLYIDGAGNYYSSLRNAVCKVGEYIGQKERENWGF